MMLCKKIMPKNHCNIAIFEESFLVQAEAEAQRCSVKKVFLEISQNPKENTFPRVSFFNKYLKRDSGTDVFL